MREFVWDLSEKKKPYWKTGKTIFPPEPLSDTEKCHCFKYFLSSVVSFPSFKAFDNRLSNTKTLWFYRINFKRLASLQAFDFNVLSHIEGGVNYGGKQANRSGRSEWRERERTSAAALKACSKCGCLAKYSAQLGKHCYLSRDKSNKMQKAQWSTKQNK